MKNEKVLLRMQQRTNEEQKFNKGLQQSIHSR